MEAEAEVEAAIKSTASTFLVDSKGVLVGLVIRGRGVGGTCSDL